METGSHTLTGTRVLDIDGTPIRVSVMPGPGTPLLLCNGIGGAIELGEPFQKALDGYPTIAFDAPAVAESGIPTYPPTMGGIARIVARVLDELGVDQVDVLGVSWGGALAQQLAHQYPDRV